MRSKDRRNPKSAESYQRERAAKNATRLKQTYNFELKIWERK